MTSEHKNIPPHLSVIFQNILKEIKPPQKELDLLNSISNELSSMIINSNIPNEIQIMKIEPEGSTGVKQTSIKNSADIDLFIILNPEFILKQNLPSKNKQRKFLHREIKKFLIDWLIPVLQKNGVGEILLSYAEHPYVSAVYKGINLDIVICFGIDKEYLYEHGPITAVDRSPHHTEFIFKTLSDRQRDDVILLKHLIKMHYCYGDKSYFGKSGFMGYLLELLIVYYGDIWTVLQEFNRLQYTVVTFADKLEPQFSPYFKKYSNKSITQIRKLHFPNDFLVVIDPTDYNRNVGSSISKRAFDIMNLTFSKLLGTPGPGMAPPNMYKTEEFMDYTLTPQELHNYYYIEFKEVTPSEKASQSKNTNNLKVVENLRDHYSKYRDKLYSFLDFLIKNGAYEKNLPIPRFENMIGEVIFDDSKYQYVLVIYTSNPIIDNEYERKGPKVSDSEHGARFKQKHPHAIQKEGYYFVRETREYNNFKTFLNASVVKRNIKNLKLREIGTAEKIEMTPLVKLAISCLYFIRKNNIK